METFSNFYEIIHTHTDYNYTHTHTSFLVFNDSLISKNDEFSYSKQQNKIVMPEFFTKIFFLNFPFFINK